MADYKKGLLSSRSCSWYIWMNVYQDVHICMLTIIMCFFQGLGLRALISRFFTTLTGKNNLPFANKTNKQKINTRNLFHCAYEPSMLMNTLHAKHLTWPLQKINKLAWHTKSWARLSTQIQERIWTLQNAIWYPGFPADVLTKSFQLPSQTLKIYHWVYHLLN